MRQSSVVLALFILCAIQVTFVGVSKIKAEQVKMEVSFSAVQYREFQHQIEILFGVEILESLDSTHCLQDFWQAYQGEGWSDNYCYRSYNHLLTQMGK